MARSEPADERRVHIRSGTSGSPLATALVADTPQTRMVGLLGRASLAPGDGLVLEPCAMIHTCFMRFPIDVLFLDRGGKVVRAVDTLKPFRLAWGWGARTTVELPAGTLKAAGIRAGEEVRIEPT